MTSDCRNPMNLLNCESCAEKEGCSDHRREMLKMKWATCAVWDEDTERYRHNKTRQTLEEYLNRRTT